MPEAVHHCQYDACTREADVRSKVFTREEKTYSRYFCEAHKNVGTEQLTDEVARKGMHPCRWDAPLTPKRKREKREQEKAAREAWEREGRASAIERFSDYGWLDRLLSDDGILHPEAFDAYGRKALRTTWQISKEQAEVRYRAGWQVAEQTMREQGRAIVLLQELLNRLEEASNNYDEWLNSDFEEPIELLKKALEDLRKQP